MPDVLTPVPIVNGASQGVQGLYNTVIVNGTTCIAPFLSFMVGGTAVSTSNTLPVNDVLGLVNTGSIAASVAASVLMEGSINAGVGSINAGIALLGTALAAGNVNTGSIVAKVATAANQALEIAALGSIVAELAGTISTTPRGNIASLDNTGTAVAAGTAFTALIAGHAAGGGFIQAPATSNIIINQQAAAVNSPGGDNIIVYATTSAPLQPSPNPVSAIILTGTSLALAGYGRV